MTQPSSTAGTAQKATTAPEAGKPSNGQASSQTSKTMSIHRSYLDRVQAIFAGKRSKPEELYNPLRRVDTSGYYIVGQLQDPMAREFVSLHYALKEEALHLPLPRNPDQVRAHDAKVVELEYLAHHALEHAWHCARDLYPDRMSLEHEEYQIVENWVIIRKKTTEDLLRERLQERGVQPKQIEHEVLELRRREDIQKNSRRRSPFEPLIHDVDENPSILEHLRELYRQSQR